MAIDRRSINILLAALDIEQHELSEMMGYDKGYVSGVGARAPSLCGCISVLLTNS